MRNRLLLLSLAVAMIPAVTAAQAPASTTPPAAPAPGNTLTVGMAVVDFQGGAVGTVTAVTADTVTVKTDKHSALLPRTGLLVRDGTALIGLTQAQLNARIEQAPKPELKVGGMVKGSGGFSIGTIDAVAADSVTIKLTGGTMIAIPRNGIAALADGGGKIALTAAQLDELVKAQPKAE